MHYFLSNEKKMNLSQMGQLTGSLNPTIHIYIFYNELSVIWYTYYTLD